MVDHLVGRHLPVRLNSMLEAVELPAGVADLATGLPDVDGDALTLWERKVTVVMLSIPKLSMHLFFLSATSAGMAKDSPKYKLPFYLFQINFYRR